MEKQKLGQIITHIFDYIYAGKKENSEGQEIAAPNNCALLEDLQNSFLLKIIVSATPPSSARSRISNQMQMVLPNQKPFRNLHALIK